jgi:hypothetical protein
MDGEVSTSKSAPWSCHFPDHLEEEAGHHPNDRADHYRTLRRPVDKLSRVAGLVLQEIYAGATAPEVDERLLRASPVRCEHFHGTLPPHLCFRRSNRIYS